MNDEAAAATLLLSTFQLGDATYGVDTMCVQEVVRAVRLTPVHHAPDYIRGVMNLRGRIVTVIDLATKIGLDSQSDALDGRIMIVDGQGEQIGVFVDAVSDVVSPDEAELSPVPANIPGAQQRYYSGVCRGNGEIITVLNLAAVLAVETADAKDDES